MSGRVCRSTKQFVIVTSSKVAAFLDVDSFFNRAPKSFFFFLFFVNLLGNFGSFSVHFSEAGASEEFMTIGKFWQFLELPVLEF